MKIIGQTWAAMPSLPGMAAAKTWAPAPVWRNSTSGKARFCGMDKKKAAILWREAVDFERQTRTRGRQDGALGRNGLAVLRVLLFDFLNYASGRLDPSISAVAAKAAISPRSAARGLASLKAAGVLNWVRRCAAEMGEAGRRVFRQLTNAYAILPAGQWLGYKARPAAPPPDPGTWGDHPPLPTSLELAAQATFEDGVAILRGDPGDSLALALARLGEAMMKGRASEVLPDCQPGKET